MRPPEPPGSTGQTCGCRVLGCEEHADILARWVLCRNPACRVDPCPLHRDAAATARRLAEATADLVQVRLALSNGLKQRDQFWKERDALRAELCRFYRADGTWETEPSPEAAIARRKRAAVVLERAQETEAERDDLLTALKESEGWLTALSSQKLLPSGPLERVRKAIARAETRSPGGGGP